MASITSPQPVAPPARVSTPYGLFSVLSFREPVDRHWEGSGVIWPSYDGTSLLGYVGPVQSGSDRPEGLPKTFTGDSSLDRAGVFTLYAHQKVTPGGGWTAESSNERARDALTSLEERSVETVLAGTVGSLEQNFSTAASVLTTDSMVEAVAALEDFLADNYGSRGVLHLSRGNALRAVAQDALETRNGGLFTRLGTPVAAGQGYPDDRIVATSALVGYRSDVFQNTGRPYDLLDKRTNDLYAIAERTYCIGYEEAALGAVTIGSPVM